MSFQLNDALTIPKPWVRFKNFSQYPVGRQSAKRIAPHGFVRYAQINWIAGGSPAAGYFLLFRQKKVTQEKATPFRRPLRGFPALLAKPGGCATRPCGPQTVLADFPRLGCATRRWKRGTSWQTIPTLALPLKGRGLVRGCGCGGELFDGYPLLHRRGWAEKSGGVGEHCLRPARPSCAATRFFDQPRAARRAGAAGCPFLWLLSFGQAKERMPAAGLLPAI